jgi:5-formyltetrahydrofolate cyclo-ligase
MNDQSSNQTPLKALKAALRVEVRARRDALDAHARERASQLIGDKLQRLDQWRTARSVLAYSSIGSELRTAPLLAATLAQGKVLVLPRINKAQRRLDLFQVSALQHDTETGVWGILEPRAQCPAVAAESVDLVIVPGLAFDSAGGRMGYGGGYYDELLPRLRPACWRIALAFAAQMVAEVPRGTHDERVDLIITEAAEYAIRTVPAPLR